MNNLLPQSIEMHHKFDLKGSTYKRHASKSEREKRSPTLKDLDFNQDFVDGIMFVLVFLFFVSTFESYYNVTMGVVTPNFQPLCCRDRAGSGQEFGFLPGFFWVSG